MAAKTERKSTTKKAKKKSQQVKATLEKCNDRFLKTGVDRSLVTRAVEALLDHHKRTSVEKNALLGNDRPVQVQFALLRAPDKSSPKPIRVLIPHPLFKLATKEGEDTTEEPEICLIVKEESKPWCQEMIDRFPDHMGCVKKVLGLQSLRKKHAQYEQRRELLNKYNVFMADDRILPMLTKALGKDFFKVKKQPIPINLNRKEALPFAIQKALSATYMTLSSGTCVMVKAGYTPMDAEKLVDNIVAIAENAVPKLPRKWANVQVISVKTPDSVALPVYNKTPEILLELAKLSGYEPNKKVVETKDETKADTKEEEKGSKKKKKKEKSPLLQALKKVEEEEKKKEKKDDKKEVKRKKESKSKRKTSDAEDDQRKDSVESNPDLLDEKKSKKESKNKRKSSDADGPKKKSSESISEILDEKKQAKKKRRKSEGDEPAEETGDFIAAKKYKGSKKGYVFRTGIHGVGYYIDVRPVVDRAAMEALKRSFKGSAKGSKKGRRGRRSY
eukprot:scaffold345_cov134-Cylindrotheca_fusiformis.AAC.96